MSILAQIRHYVLTYVTGQKIEEDSSYVTGFFASNSNFDIKFKFRAPNVHIRVRKSYKDYTGYVMGVQPCSGMTMSVVGFYLVLVQTYKRSGIKSSLRYRNFLFAFVFKITSKK